MAILAAEMATGRSLVRDDLFRRLVDQIVNDGHAELRQAERIMDQALVFLKACADNPGETLRPSKAVDIGWHTFILHTHDYSEFCERVAGRFLHHVPERFDPPARPSETLAPTVEVMKTTGLIVDPTLWAQGADCTQCHGGCTECGQDGPRQ